MPFSLFSKSLPLLFYDLHASNWPLEHLMIPHFGFMDCVVHPQYVISNNFGIKLQHEKI